MAALAQALWAAAPARDRGNVDPARALQGLDVVSGFQSAGPVKGLPTLSHEFGGTHHLIANARNRAAFVAAPDRYLPQFDGPSTAGLSKGFIGHVHSLVWKIVGGKLYLFRTAERIPSDAQTA